MPWFIDTVVALDVDHVSRLDWPVEIDAGAAVSDAVGGMGPSAAIGQINPEIPARVVGVQLAGGRGTTDVLL